MTALDAAAEIVRDRALDALVLRVEGLRAGDLALAAALDLDGTVARSGADAVPDLDEGERVAGLAALRWFGVPDAAAILERYVERRRRGTADEAAELAATDAYDALDVDSRLVDGLRLRLADSPDSFAPLDLPRPQRP